jgi:hypothetical protein
MSPTLSASILFASAVFAEPADSATASTFYSPGHQSCRGDTTDSTMPTTSGDIQNIVMRYVTDLPCGPRLRAALETVFADEHRDEVWAGSLERIVKEAALAQGAKIAGSCHASLCRYDIELTPSVESERSPHALEHRVIDSTSGTSLQVESLQSYGSNFKFTIYFYSTVVPAAFVEPLRRIMVTGDTLP